MGIEELLSAINNPRTIQDHPDWPAFCKRKLPQYISFYYTNKEGHEAFWDQARVIKIDASKMIMTIEGAHGDPIKFDIFKILHCKNIKTGERAQDIFIDLIRMWRDIYEPAQ